MKKAIVTISGGIDSAVAAAIAKKEGYELYFLTVNYGQKNIEKELNNSKRLAKFFDAKEHKIINMQWLGELGNSGITDANIQLENELNELIYVPYRNTCIISACIAWAEILEVDAIFTGSIGETEICPDNTPEYYEKFNEFIKVSTKLNKKVKIIAPLDYCTKEEVIKKGIQLNVPFEHTWTCVSNADKACGICKPCHGRLNAFKNLNLNDPILYKNKEEK